MSKYHDLAQSIIENVGGEENIKSLNHCVTRLRFKLKDESKANDKAFESMDGVVTVMKSGGQYQVVIGNHVPHVYNAIIDQTNLDSGKHKEEVEEDSSDNNFLNKFIDVVAGSFQPFLGVMAASGMIKGFMALFVSLNLLETSSGTYILLNSFGDAIFKFLPIVIGYTSAKKFKLNPFIGMVIGAAFSYPTLQLNYLKANSEVIGNVFNTDIYLKFLGMPVMVQNYEGGVVPVLFVVWFASRVQKISYKVVPEIVQIFVVPFVTIVISLIVGFIVVGPIVSLAINLVGNAFLSINAFSPILAAVFVGFIWQVLVVFGLHWGIVAIHLIMLQQFGYSNVMSGYFGASFAQTAVVFAMYLKIQEPKLKSLGIPAIISGIFGITEPAIYTFTLPEKKPFLYSMIGAAVGGIFMGYFDATAYTSGGLGVFGVFNYINPANGDMTGFYAAIATIIVSAIVGFLLTYFLWKPSNEGVEA